MLKRRERNERRGKTIKILQVCKSCSLYFSAEAANLHKMAKVLRQNQQRIATAIDRGFCATGSVLTLTNDNVNVELTPVVCPTPKRVAPAVPASKSPPPPPPDRYSSLPKHATGAAAFFPPDMGPACAGSSATLPKKSIFGRSFGKSLHAEPKSLAAEFVELRAMGKPTISDPIPIVSPAPLDNWQ